MASTSFSLLEIERFARAAQAVPALAFSMVNDGWGLLGFRQAVVMRKSAGRWGAQAVSGLIEIGETTPYQNWLRRVCLYVEQSKAVVGAPLADDPGASNAVDAPDELNAGTLLQLTRSDLPEELAQEWDQWWPVEVIYFVLRGRVLPHIGGGTTSGRVNGLAFYLFDEPVVPTRRAGLTRLAEVWCHAWAMLSGIPRRSLIPERRTRWLLAVILIAALFIPVRQSVLAPAEIISLESVVLASPLEGVVREVLVRPNQAVLADQPLVALDDTVLRNRREVLLKSVGSAQAELLATTQKSFDNLQSRGDIAPLSGRVEERRAELAFIDEQLQRMALTAPKAGITVFGDPNDWRGRSVVAGERIMLIANPAKLGVLIHVPVADAIAVGPGASVRLFLHVAPLSPMDGQVIETGYQALLSPDNIASYRVRATLAETRDQPGQQRIGLKGTAKLYGGRVSLGYWLMRRPLAAAREWMGL